jgi:hypothetical protein
MLPIHLALVPIARMNFSDVAKVSAAIQKQIIRDFSPLWTIEATIDAFPKPEDVPVGYWPIFIVDTFQTGGQHKTRHNQPFGLVAAGSSWSLAASHEALEMLVDPAGDRLVAGASPMPNQGRVEFLLEVCDPCQSDHHAYTVNGILVSDFCAPEYFDPVGVTGARYSYTGSITAPHEVLRGGYLSWRDPETGNWFQQNFTGATQNFRNLGPIQPGALMSLRSMIDGQSSPSRPLSNLKTTAPAIKKAARVRASAERAATQQAKPIQEFLNQLRRQSSRRSRPAKR